MNPLNKMIAEMEAENIAEEANRPGPNAKAVASEAAFLKKWSKGKPIVRQSSSATFWAAGKWMTKLDAKMADALVAAGYATLSGKSTERGATLKMIK